ncbi:MAG: metallophosphoesterase [Oscillospiraceae bacterium]|nr:metallophosphoesterase [Oscillospiraceae bacterium]
MRILFLHLSDLHIENELGLNLPRVQSLVQSLQGFDHVDGIVIAISGDLARNGKRDEYRLVSLFMDCLLMKITDSYALDSKDIKILLIPGNHDIDWGDSRSINPASIRQLSNLGLHSAYQTELEKMDSFFWYSNKHGCFNMSRFQREENQVFTRKILHFSSGYRIEANLINTAPFSCENDDGLHYLPPTALYEFSKPSNADLALVMMHHSPDWFPFDMKKQICQSINERCSLAFYGHDHVPGSEVISLQESIKLFEETLVKGDCLLAVALFHLVEDKLAPGKVNGNIAEFFIIDKTLYASPLCLFPLFFLFCRKFSF